MSTNVDQVENWVDNFEELHSTGQRVQFEEYESSFPRNVVSASLRDSRETVYEEGDLLESSYDRGIEELDSIRRRAELKENLESVNSLFDQIPGSRKDRLGDWSYQRGYESVNEEEIEDFSDLEGERPQEVDVYTVAGSGVAIGGMIGSLAGFQDPFLQILGAVGSTMAGLGILHTGAMKKIGRNERLNEIEYDMLTDKISDETEIKVV